jgi:DNA-binding NarL/FixJ family response regulator
MSALEGRSAVLLDPHPLWLEAVERVLTDVGVTIAGRTTTIDQALVLIEQLQADILVVEIETPNGRTDGLTVLERARECAPSTKCIVLSGSHDRRDFEAAFAAGAVAYVLKTAHSDDLALTVRQAFAQSVYFAEARSESVVEPVTRIDRERTADLTRRELEILRLVAEGHSNAQLARMLWVTEQTVKFHLSNIYRKLDVSNRTEASRWAQLNGLLPVSMAAASAA